MFKKALAMGLALLLAGLAACGKADTPTETAETTETTTTASSAPTEESAPDTAETEESGAEASLYDLVDAMGPANKHDALSLAYILFGQKVTETTEAMEAAGLAEEEVFQSYLVEWSRLATENVMGLLSLYADRDEEELAGLADDPSYMTLWDLYMEEMDKEYARMNIILADPQQWVEMAKGSDAAAVDHETDGSWPEGFFFSDRVPAIEGFDSFKTTTAGQAYGIADAEEGALFFIDFTHDEMQAYIDALLAAGAEEQVSQGSEDSLVWAGKIEDEAGCVSIMAIQDSSSEGSANSPQGIIMYCNWDYYVVTEEKGIR